LILKSRYYWKTNDVESLSNEIEKKSLVPIKTTKPCALFLRNLIRGIAGYHLKNNCRSEKTMEPTAETKFIDRSREYTKGNKYICFDALKKYMEDKGR